MSNNPVRHCCRYQEEDGDPHPVAERKYKIPVDIYLNPGVLFHAFPF